MKRAVKQIAVAALVLLVLCVVCRFFFCRTYTVFFPLIRPLADSSDLASFRIVPDDPVIAAAGSPEAAGNYLKIPILPGQAGQTGITILDDTGEEIGLFSVRVTRFHTVIDGITDGFSGDTAVMLAAAVFWFLTGAVMLWNFLQAKGPAFYQHLTVWFAGFGLFALVTGACLLEVSVRHLLNPAEYSMRYIYSALSGASSRFMLLTAPLFVAFAVAMAVSNIALLRHEHPRPQNMLGLLISILLILGLALGLYLNWLDFMGSETEYRIRMTLINTYTTLFVYFECMLAGSVICGITAAKRRPAPDKDFIVILGCWFRKDGSLPPLLQGRVDRALSFWQKQKETTGKEACFVPSGGQGPDESMPEAEAMRRYLLSKGIPDRLILPETASKNTLENMSFSKKIILENSPDAKVVFATTNYHVFRSGVWASLAGLPAEGIGSRTKWWFWPNAFIRETVGLLQKRWKQEIVFLILLLLWFGTLSMIIG